MSEVEVETSAEQCNNIKCITKEGIKLSEMCTRLKRQFGMETLPDISIYKYGVEYLKRMLTEKIQLFERDVEL